MSESSQDPNAAHARQFSVPGSSFTIVQFKTPTGKQGINQELEPGMQKQGTKGTISHSHK